MSETDAKPKPLTSTSSQHLIQASIFAHPDDCGNLLMGLPRPFRSPFNPPSTQQPEGSFENANLTLSPPTRILQRLPLPFRWRKDSSPRTSRPCAVGPLPCLHTHPLCAPATLAFSQMPSPTPTSFMPQGLCPCSSLSRAFYLTFTPTKLLP